MIGKKRTSFKIIKKRRSTRTLKMEAKKKQKESKENETTDSDNEQIHVNEVKR